MIALLLDHRPEADLLDFFAADRASDGALLSARLDCGQHRGCAEETRDKQEDDTTHRQTHAALLLAPNMEGAARQISHRLQRNGRQMLWGGWKVQTSPRRVAAARRPRNGA
jgi:hypothetical protein